MKTLDFGCVAEFPARGEVKIGNFHISSFSCLAVTSNIFNHGQTTTITWNMANIFVKHLPINKNCSWLRGIHVNLLLKELFIR